MQKRNKVTAGNLTSYRTRLTSQILETRTALTNQKFADSFFEKRNRGFSDWPHFSPRLANDKFADSFFEKRNRLINDWSKCKGLFPSRDICVKWLVSKTFWKFQRFELRKRERRTKVSNNHKYVSNLRDFETEFIKEFRNEFENTELFDASKGNLERSFQYTISYYKIFQWCLAYLCISLVFSLKT